MDDKKLKKILYNDKKYCCQSCINNEEENESEGSSCGDTSDMASGSRMVSDRSRSSSSPIKQKLRKRNDYSIGDIMNKLNIMQKKNRKLLKNIEYWERESKITKQKIEKLEIEQKKMREEIEMLKKDEQKNVKYGLQNNIVTKGLLLLEIPK